MSEKEHTVPGETLRDGPAGEENTGAPIETRPESSGGERENSQSVSRETSDASPAQARNKRSSFYVYLAVLFGAAFLMLLLAYFVQRRNNETAQSDLRSSFSATRQELLDEIEGLEEEKQGLLAEKEALQAQLTGLQEEIGSLNEQVAIEHHAYVECYDRFEALQQFALLEQALREQDWDTAAKRTRALCSGVLELDMARIELPGEAPFDPRARLEEVIPLLEKRGALESGEVSVPGSTPSN